MKITQEGDTFIIDYEVKRCLCRAQDFNPQCPLATPLQIHAHYATLEGQKLYDRLISGI